MNLQFFRILHNGGLSTDAAYELAKLNDRLEAVELNAETVTAGAPSTFGTTQTYSVSPPKSIVGLTDVTPTPNTHWVATHYALCADGTKAYWNGTKWLQGVSPGFSATGATAGTPGSFTPTGANVPANLAALVALNPTASPGTAWTVGQRVALGTGTAHWSGTAWVTGNA